MPDIAVQVISKRALARDVVALRLAPYHAGDQLPAFDAGAHIELRLPNGLTRAYSLTNAGQASAPTHYDIAVSADANSRGGSVTVHDKVHVGSRLSIAAPRNHFALDHGHQRVLLIAGGIGVTPIYAMAQALAQQGRDYQVVFAARSASRMAYLEELRGLCGSRLHVHADDVATSPVDLAAWLQAEPWDGVYACGPAAMLDAIATLTASWPSGKLRTERFSAPTQTDAATAQAFELELRTSGLSTTVAPQESVLDAIERLGIAHPFSCREGICGTCEARVIDGDIDHRCTVLSEAEKGTQTIMMPCVSRCAAGKLTLDI
jgi:ferredoxin-NADP reductase